MERVKRLSDMVGGRGELAQRSGLSRSVIDKYLNGQSEPSRQRLLTLAEAGGVTVQWLSTGEPPMRPGDLGAEADPLNIIEAAIDKHLLSRAIEGVRKVYQRHGITLPAVNEAEIAADIYQRVKILRVADDGERGALLMALDQLDRDLSAAPATKPSGKRSA